MIFGWFLSVLLLMAIVLWFRFILFFFGLVPGSAVHSPLGSVNRPSTPNQYGCLVP